MFWVENTYAKIWKIDKKEKYADLRISTSEKDNREEGKYINSNWFARTIGHAFNQISNGEFNEGDRVKIVKGKISNESYTDKNGEKKSMLKVIILELANPNGDSSSAPAAEKKAPAKKPAAKKKNEEISDDDLPF